MAGWRLGIDIGGTFTDVIAVPPPATAGRRRSAKVPSQPQEPVRAIVDAISAVGLTWPEVEEIVHGTTIVTNDIVETRLRPCALIATAGFSDTIEIARGSRRHLYRMEMPPRPAPLVPAELRFEVDERLDHEGRIVRPLSDADIARVVSQVKASGVDTVAVCLMHAFRNPEHERRLGVALREALPHVSLSHEVSPECREFERMNTTVLNAMMMAKIKHHLGLIAERQPHGSRLHLMHSASGMAAPALIAERPLMLAMSGPAAGVAASCEIAAKLGISHAITFDMGGTTTDVCLVVDGRAQIAVNRDLGGQRIRMPMVAVDSIGAGGGSIARLISGALTVGPESAGARPGPACYGTGGTQPTVSDADAVLGNLNPARTLGGSITLSVERAEGAIRPLAEAMEFSVAEAAAGITRVVHANMARALRRATVERGLDLRQFDMIAFGGAGPMHAVEVARLCGIGRIVVPAFSSGFSALGCVEAVMSYSRQMTLGMKSGDWDQAALDRTVAAQVEDLSSALIAAGHRAATLAITMTAGIRYSGQSYETQIDAPALDRPDTLGQQFDAAHRALYGYATGEPWELSSLRIEVSAPTESKAPADAPITGEDAPPGRRRVTFETGETFDVAVLARASMVPGETIQGPLIVEDEWSTIVVPPSDRIAADAAGHLTIEVAL
ncbi:hydantoinase/oxoprolinase family protein [Bosea sp. 685]|uniref:hydantoinase/oxoprolinase family protein n=1 Tax=Bosea sp. 685 TaxID=3080057 RepID=UPI002892BD88|nr:hydantoinase/oxoprolinase family protein [Bosea sp. 685]WNJ88085.1 hydantoinase/oxoprolinase family protein [Bosea sp. 685]